MFTSKATICINYQPIAVNFILKLRHLPSAGMFFPAWHIAFDPLLLSTALFKVEVHVSLIVWMSDTCSCPQERTDLQSLQNGWIMKVRR